MCGLAGVVTWDERFRVSREMLASMSACIAHRGPDYEGAWVNYDAAPSPARPVVRLAHRRLAIIDLDPRANQPFRGEAGASHIVYNGEIYNYLELRAELSRIRPDYLWRTSGDTEVLLLAYETWRERCLEKLNGMYALAIWNEPLGELFLARDRMGQKPLYYAIATDGSSQTTAVSGRVPSVATPVAACAFASELPALRALPWVDATPNPDGVTDYLCYGYVPSPRTIYRGVVKLPPASWVRLTRKTAELQSYFRPNEPQPIREAPVAVRQTRELVTQAVKRQLVADVPLGCFLSGGIDSSVVAAAMKAAVPASQEVLTFSIGFQDKRYDETGYAAAVARHLGTRHRQFIVRPDAAEDLPKLARVFGEPFGDSSALPTHYLSRETRKHVTVALSGDGGDELFCGYDRYRAAHAAEAMRTLPGFVQRLLQSPLWQRMPGAHPKSLPARLKRFQAGLSLRPSQRYAQFIRLFDDPAAARLLKVDWHGYLLASRNWLIDLYQDAMAGRGAAQTAMALDRLSYLPEDLLTKADRCSMLHSLEVRAPFMDHDLVRFATSLTTEQLLGGGPKRMLREAFAPDLPKFVFKRKKMGFAVPIGEWFRAELREMLHDHLYAQDSFARQHFDADAVDLLIGEHEARRVDHSQRLYALLMLEIWWRQNR